MKVEKNFDQNTERVRACVVVFDAVNLNEEANMSSIKFQTKA